MYLTEKRVWYRQERAMGSKGIDRKVKGLQISKASMKREERENTELFEPFPTLPQRGSETPPS